MLNTFAKTLTRVCLALLLVNCSVEDPKQYIAEGKALFENGELESARVQFQNALQLDPKLAEAYFQMALLDEKKQNWAGMLNNLMEAVTVDPKHLQGQLKLGQIYLVGGQLDKAAERSKMALALSPQDPMALLLQASVQFRQGQLAEAMQGVAAVLAKQPFLPEAVGLQANILAADKKPSAAIAVLHAGIEHSPAHADLRLLKIRLEIDSQQFDAAVRDYQALIAQQPDDIGFPVSLANLLRQMGRQDEAEDALRTAIEQHPGKTMLQLTLVDMLDQRHAEQTEATLKAFISQSPKAETLRFRLADFYLKHSRLADAENLLRAIASADAETPDGVAAKLKLAEMALLQKDKTNVERLAEEVLAIDANNSDALLLRAGMRLSQQDADGAIADLRIVLRNRPNTERALLLLAQASLLKGENEMAESQWRKVLDINPDNMTAIIGLSNQLLKRGDYARAEELSVKAAKANPNAVAPVEMLIQLKAKQQNWPGAQKALELLKAIPDKELALNYWRGFLAAKQGHMEEAIKAYQDALNMEPTHAQTWAALSELYQVSIHRAELMAFLTKFAAKHPAVLQVQQLLAAAYSAEKNWPAAENALGKASEIAANPIEFKLQQVDVIERQSEARAEAALKRFIQASPDQTGLKFRLARFYIDRQRYAVAVPVLQDIVGLDPASKTGLTAKLKLAELAWLLKQSSTANALLAEVITKEPLRNEALLLRASQRMVDGDTSAAIADLQQVLTDRPDTELALSMLAQAFQKANKQNELITLLQSRVEAHPNDVHAYLLLARVFASQGKDVDAELTYQKGLVASGNNPQLMIERAKFYVVKQDFDKAMDAYEEIVKNHPTNDEAANNLAVLLASYRTADKASLARALALIEPFKTAGNPALRDSYGWVHLKAGDVKNALPVLQMAAEGAPKDPTIHYHLAVAHHQQGSISAAIVELEKSLALAKEQVDFPDFEAAKALLRACRPE